MAGLARQLFSLVDYLARRRSHHGDDAAAVRELAWTPRDAPGDSIDLPAGLELQWLGTSGFRLAYEGTRILIDPYVSRIGFGDVLRRRTALPSDDAIARHIDGADAILIGHTHFDHALDTPAIARRFGARAYGSRSLYSLMALHGLADHAVEVVPYRVYEVGPFAITFVPSVHSKLVLGLSIPYDYDITCEHLDGLVPQAYGCGQVFGIHIEVAGVSFYHQGSAELIDDAIRHRGVDYFLAGIAGRGFSDRYVERILSALRPKVVVPHHFDNFFRPLDAPMEFSFNVHFAGFIDEVTRVSREFEVRSLQPLQTVVAGQATSPS